jgi:hypothetical protein
MNGREKACGHVMCLWMDSSVCVIWKKSINDGYAMHARPMVQVERCSIEADNRAIGRHPDLSSGALPTHLLVGADPPRPRTPNSSTTTPRAFT